MRRKLLIFGLALAAATAVAQPQLSVEQRLERLERRAASITDLTLKLQALRQETSARLWRRAMVVEATGGSWWEEVAQELAAETARLRNDLMAWQAEDRQE